MNSKAQAEWILLKSRFKTYIETLLISFVKLSRLKLDQVSQPVYYVFLFRHQIEKK